MNKLFIFFIFSLLIYACGEDENNTGDPNQPLIFSSLVTDKDTIEAGGRTTIKALATGYKIQFFWSATTGDILGKDSAVIYAASPCQVGKNTISCEVKDGNGNSEKKEILIEVQ